MGVFELFRSIFDNKRIYGTNCFSRTFDGMANNNEGVLFVLGKEWEELAWIRNSK